MEQQLPLLDVLTCKRRQQAMLIPGDELQCVALVLVDDDVEVGAFRGLENITRHVREFDEEHTVVSKNVRIGDFHRDRACKSSIGGEGVVVVWVLGVIVTDATG